MHYCIQILNMQLKFKISRISQIFFFQSNIANLYPIVLSSRTDFFVDMSGQISSRRRQLSGKKMVRK